MSMQIHDGCKLDCRPNNMMKYLKELQTRLYHQQMQIARTELMDWTLEFCSALAQYELDYDAIFTVLGEYVPEYTPESEKHSLMGMLAANPRVFLQNMTRLWMLAYQNKAHEQFQYPGFHASFRLYIIPDHTGVYCLPSGSLAAVGRFKTMPGVTEYDYYDNTDRPEGITKAAWEARKHRWLKLLDSGDIYCDSLIYDAVRPDRTFVHRVQIIPEWMDRHIEKNRERLATLYTCVRAEEAYQAAHPECDPGEEIRRQQQFRERLASRDLGLIQLQSEILKTLPATWADCTSILDKARDVLQKHNAPAPAENK